MSEIRPYASCLSDPASRRHGTFSYLPVMSDAQIREQVAYILSRGWNPAIEYSEPENADYDFWYMWKLPLFGEKDVDRVLAEARACHEAHPGFHVKLVGLDSVHASRGTEMVVYRGESV